MKKLKDLFKKSIKLTTEFDSLNSTNLDTITLYCCQNNDPNKYILTGLITFQNNKFIDDYFELANNYTIKTLCKQFQNEYYVYIYGSLLDYKKTINTLNPNNPFFKAILNLCKNFQLYQMKEFIEDGLINGNDINPLMNDNLYEELIIQQYQNIPNKVFSILELSKVIEIDCYNRDHHYGRETIYDFINLYIKTKIDDFSNSNKNIYEIFQELFKTKDLEKIFCTNNYKQTEIQSTNFEDEIFEPIEGSEEEYEIKEDEDGNLKYNKELYY